MPAKSVPTFQKNDFVKRRSYPGVDGRLVEIFINILA